MTEARKPSSLQISSSPKLALLSDTSRCEAAQDAENQEADCAAGMKQELGEHDLPKRQRRFRTQGGGGEPSEVSLEKPDTGQEHAVRTVRAQVRTGHPAPFKDPQTPFTVKGQASPHLPSQVTGPAGAGRPRVASSVTGLPAMKNGPSDYTPLSEEMCPSQPEV